MVEPGEVEVFPGLKQHLLESLSMLDSGLLPPDVQWRIVHTPLRRGARRRLLSGKEWKLEEFGSEGGGAAGAGENDPRPEGRERSAGDQ